MRNAGIGLVVIACASLTDGSAMAVAHLWQIVEAFSNADGTIQFIEMKECCGGNFEWFLEGKYVRSDATGNEYVFPENLEPGTTGHRHILLATAGFAALPGAPTPDHIVQDGFFAIDGDTLRFWTYKKAIMSFGAGALPTNGIDSLSRDGATACNSPTNYEFEGGYVQVNCNAADIDGGGVGVTDFLLLLAEWGPCP